MACLALHTLGLRPPLTPDPAAPRRATCSLVSAGSLSSLQAVRACADSLRLGQADLSLALGAENPASYPFLLPHSREVHNAASSPLLDPLEHHFLRSLPHFFAEESALQSPNSQPKHVKKQPHFSAFSEGVARAFRLSRADLDRQRARSVAKLLKATNEGSLCISSEGSSGSGLRDERRVLAAFREFAETAAQTPDSQLRSALCDEVLLESLTRPSPAVPMFTEGPRSLSTTHHFPALASGACGVLLCSDAHLSRTDSRPLCQVLGAGFGSRAPSKCEGQVFSLLLDFLAAHRLSLDEVDFLEIHEGSAALLAVLEKFASPHLRKVNVRGGALASGLVPGAAGAHLVLNAASLLGEKGFGKAVVLAVNEVGDFGILLLSKSQ